MVHKSIDEKLMSVGKNKNKSLQNNVKTLKRLKYKLDEKMNLKVFQYTIRTSLKSMRCHKRILRVRIH